MIPIYEQGTGNGIGHNIDSFLSQFENIIKNHIKNKRAKSFAFIFYDFHDKEIKDVLKNQGVFAQLDRLSGAELSIFYLHSSTDKSTSKFNEHFFKLLGLSSEAATPCVVFFNVCDEGVNDISVANLQSPDLIHGFKEIYDIISCHIGKLNEKQEPKYIKWLKASVGLVTLESIKVFIQETIKKHFFE